MIDQRHQIPLTTAVTASLPGKGALAEALYNEALAVFLNKSLQGGGIIRNRDAFTDTTNENVQRVVAVATDEQTGLYVQMTGVFSPKTGKAVEGPWLSLGKKYLQEGKSPQLSNNAIKLWR